MPLALPLVVLFVVWDNMEVSKKARATSQRRELGVGEGSASSLWKPFRLSSLSPGSLGSDLPQPSLRASTTPWALGGVHGHLWFLSPCSRKSRLHAAGVSYLAATNFLPSLSLRTKKVKISKDWEVKNVPCHSLGWDNKDKAGCNVKQEILFLPRTSHSCKMAWRLLLSYSPRNFVLQNHRPTETLLFEIVVGETSHTCLEPLIHFDTEKQLKLHPGGQH